VRSETGFTLLEIMLAMLILGMVVAMVSMSLSGSIKVIEGATDQGNLYYRAQVVFERISEDLNGAMLPDDVEFKGGQETSGDGQRVLLSFASLAHLVFDAQTDQPGLGLISYAVQPDTEDSRQLLLLRADSLYHPQGGEKTTTETEAFLLSDRLRSVTLTFLDRNGEELESWDTTARSEEPDKKRRLPAAVSCRLEFWLDVDTESTIIFQSTMLLPVGLIRPEDTDDTP
jgi:prepilin-type N-terminal cleavage/methylation domain-containing protein